MKKLRLPEDGKVLVLQPPDGFLQELGLDADAASVQDGLQGVYDYVQLFAASVSELEQYGPQALAAIKHDGLLWLCYPKGSAGLKTDLSRDKGWELVWNAGYEGISLVSIDAKWSAMRFRPLGATSRRRPEASGSAAKPKAPGAEPAVPDDLLAALGQNEAAHGFFQGLAPSHRKAYITWITEAKREETRVTRIAQTVEKLVLGRKNPSDKGTV
ncbi:YdeI/OmpD-associated family protein [Paenibacillus tengchongensis]|uniref:YdeI/OmpD-associated family protein n=1 Tax=Paenibacillus tengchongensis TaxID=2608684 RepID=UPI001652849C|nr:YdeI/OmpD-associated family protein [Paenibacillus tengchongensis]